MNRHQQIWDQAKTELSQTIDRIKTTNSELYKAQDDLAQRIAQKRDAIKYADSSDKPWLVQELKYLMDEEARTGEKIRSSTEGMSSPYFNKLVTDQHLYISKYLSEPDKNIVKYTSPIAALRYKEVGETGKVNGFRHHIREKQILDILQGQLSNLDHADPDTAFTYDGANIQITREAKPRDIEVKKENLVTPQESPVETEPKKYVLGEIIAKMREEQDIVMRAPHQGVTLVKGAAGSGKTNIAFHRIVYLTTEHPDKFRQDNVAVFCYNVALKKYLSNMLIELNIPRVNVFSLDDWVISTLKHLTNIGWVDYDREDSTMKLLKTRKEILPILGSFYQDFKRQLHQTLTKVEVQEETEIRIDGVKILNMLYLHEPFLEHIGCHDDFTKGKYSPGSSIDHSDLYILAWLVHLTIQAMELKVFGYYDHVVVDEVQDLMPIQLALINEHHKGSMTLVGDVTQRINEQGVDSWGDFTLRINHTHELSMCHRATLQTVLFANELLTGVESMISTKVGKQGDKPCIFEARNRTDALRKAVSYVKQIKANEPQASVAVLSFRNYDLNWINEQLKDGGVDSYIATKKDWEFSPRVAVTTYYQVKGLEFDYVIVLGLNDYELKKAPNMDKVIYTVVTRAQKRVFIAFCKELPEMIKGVDNDLYVTG